MKKHKLERLVLAAIDESLQKKDFDIDRLIPTTKSTVVYIPEIKFCLYRYLLLCFWFDGDEFGWATIYDFVRTTLAIDCILVSRLAYLKLIYPELVNKVAASSLPCVSYWDFVWAQTLIN